MSNLGMAGMAVLAALAMQSSAQRNQSAGDTADASGAKPTTFGGDVVLKPAPGQTFDVAPEWIRRPSGAIVGAVFPTAGIREGLDGFADLRCTLTVDGALTGCVVEKEGPVGKGFGAAAKTLTPDLNIKPAQKGGRSVASNVALSVTFVGPGVRTGSFIAGKDTTGAQTVLTGVTWLKAPTYAQVVAAYPAAGRAQNKGGRATLFCTFNAEGGFRACDINNEEPAGLGFGEAAKQLAAGFQAPATLPSGASIDGAAIKIPFTFSERMLVASGRPATGRPAIASMPTNADFGAAFPVAAKRASVLSSDVMLDCAIAEGGSLSACSVASENPAGYGFGQAALSLTPKFQINPWSAEGLPVVGGRVRLPMKYQLKTAG